jgi:hypothetical protein
MEFDPRLYTPSMVAYWIAIVGEGTQRGRRIANRTSNQIIGVARSLLKWYGLTIMIVVPRSLAKCGRSDEKVAARLVTCP